MVRILIVEDELIISQDMCNMLSNMGYHVIGDAMDYDEAVDLLNKETPDLILLDVNLNGRRDGIDLAIEINNTYKVPFIFTTSYSDAKTLERAKKTNPVNYLVKPFKSEQLFTAIEMALHKLANTSATVSTPQQEDTLLIKDAIFIKDKFKYSKIVIADILWIKSEGNYLEVHTVNRDEVIRASMNNFIERLDHKDFFRTHKSYIVNLNYVTHFETSNVTIIDTKIPISKTYIDGLVRRLNII
ncbi:LytR/AlgR family response regulator transcription factor [Flavobacterium pallidum]|uniref:DNA-binding response regulator n=1 Tax=Flavobacterium pallidum TaxID=2172098 RepID=A0A2S1SGV7_9FLAO|nr:response regulator [Flavobacterium pallidum]AWI25644.1 DNA-binding response regulator [Flavobacterium pallidum]